MVAAAAAAAALGPEGGETDVGVWTAVGGDEEPIVRDPEPEPCGETGEWGGNVGGGTRCVDTRSSGELVRDDGARRSIAGCISTSILLRRFAGCVCDGGAADDDDGGGSCDCDCDCDCDGGSETAHGFSRSAPLKNSRSCDPNQVEVLT